MVAESTDDWREISARRDFTINAMSSDADGVLFDYFGGEADCVAGWMRCVGEAAARIAELFAHPAVFQIFRAVPAWAPDVAAVAAIRGGVAGLAQLSAERVWSELKKILATTDPVPAVALMEECGVLGAVLPEGTEVAGLARLVAAGGPGGAEVEVGFFAEWGCGGGGGAVEVFG